MREAIKTYGNYIINLHLMLCIFILFYEPTGSNGDVESRLSREPDPLLGLPHLLLELPGDDAIP